LDRLNILYFVDSARIKLSRLLIYFSHVWLFGKSILALFLYHK